MAEAVSGGVSPALLESLHALEHPSGAIGAGGELDRAGACSRSARRASRSRPQTVRFVVRAQTKSGGFAWATRRCGPTPTTRPRPCRRSPRQACTARRSRGRLRFCARASGPTVASSCSRAGLERAVDVVGDPGLHRRADEAARGGLPVPAADATGGRQPPLLAALRDDAAVGLRAGAARAGAASVSAAVASTA